MAINFLKVRTGLTLRPGTAPASPENGDIYYDSGTNLFSFYQNGTWINISTVVAANTALSNLSSVAINTSLLPGLDNSIDLGNSSFKFRTIYAGTSIQNADGSQSLPSYSFGSDTGLGIYRIAANQIGFATNGILRTTLSTTQTLTTLPIRVAAGSAASPSYSFSDAPDSGLYAGVLSNSEVTVASAGVKIAHFSSGGLFFGGGVTASAMPFISSPGTNGNNLNITLPNASAYLAINANGSEIWACRDVGGDRANRSAANLHFSTDNTFDIGIKLDSTNLRPRSIYVGTSIRNALGTVALPSYTFNGDTNTGISAPNADELFFSTGGTEAMRIRDDLGGGTYQQLSFGPDGANAPSIGASGSGILRIFSGTPVGSRISFQNRGAVVTTMFTMNDTENSSLRNLVMADGTFGSALAIKWQSDGGAGNNIGATASGRPNDVFIKNALRVGTSPALSTYAGYIQSGNADYSGEGLVTVMGSFVSGTGLAGGFDSVIGFLSKGPANHKLLGLYSNHLANRIYFGKTQTDGGGANFNMYLEYVDATTQHLGWFSDNTAIIGGSTGIHRPKYIYTGNSQFIGNSTEFVTSLGGALSGTVQVSNSNNGYATMNYNPGGVWAGFQDAHIGWTHNALVASQKHFTGWSTNANDTFVSLVRNRLDSASYGPLFQFDFGTTGNWCALKWNTDGETGSDIGQPTTNRPLNYYGKGNVLVGSSAQFTTSLGGALYGTVQASNVAEGYATMNYAPGGVWGSFNDAHIGFTHSALVSGQKHFTGWATNRDDTFINLVRNRLDSASYAPLFQFDFGTTGQWCNLKWQTDGEVGSDIGALATSRPLNVYAKGVGHFGSSAAFELKTGRIAVGNGSDCYAIMGSSIQDLGDGGHSAALGWMSTSIPSFVGVQKFQGFVWNSDGNFISLASATSAGRRIRFDFLSGTNMDMVWDGGDGSGNIGQSGAKRPNNVYVKTSVVVGDTVTIGTSSVIGSTLLDLKATGANSLSLYTNGSARLVIDSTGNISASSNKITNLANGTAANDAVNKSQLDAVSAGLDVKASVRAATTANITLSAPQTIDGVSVVAGNRVLVKDQTTATENGIYVVNAGAWTRSTDADNSPAGEVTAGMFTFVEEGTVSADIGYVLVTNDPITLGTTSLSFSQFSSVGGGANKFLSNLTSPTAINQHLLFGTDNTNDIGASAATRPRSIYVGTNLYMNTAASRIQFSSHADNWIDANSNNRMHLNANSEMDFTTGSGPRTFVIGGSTNKYMEIATHLIANTDAAFDFGFDGPNYGTTRSRFRDGFLSRDLYLGGTAAGSNTSTSKIYFGSQNTATGYISNASSDGIKLFGTTRVALETGGGNALIAYATTGNPIYVFQALSFTADNANDIGNNTLDDATNRARPRSAYIGTNLFLGGTADHTVSGADTSTSKIYFGSRTSATNKIESNASGSPAGRLLLYGGNQVGALVNGTENWTATASNLIVYRTLVISDGYGTMNIQFNGDGVGSIGTSATSGRPDKVHIKNELTLGGVKFDVTQARITTTDATVTTLQDVAVPTDSVMLIEARVVARRTGGTAGSSGDSSYYVIKVRAKNISGTVTLHNIVSEESEDQSGWNADIIVSTTNARIEVTGATDNNVSWETTTLTQTLTT